MRIDDSQYKPPQLSAAHRRTLEQGSAIRPEVIAARGYLTARNLDELKACVHATGGYTWQWPDRADDEQPLTMLGVCYDADWYEGPHGHDRTRISRR